MCTSVGKAKLLSDHFYSKKSRESVDLPLSCHSSPSLTTLAFLSSEVRRFLLDLNTYGGTDPLRIFPHFRREPQMSRLVADWCLRVVFRELIGRMVFRLITSILIGRSSSVDNFRPFCIRLSKAFERLVRVRLRRFMERSGVLSTTHFAYLKGLGTCDALMCVFHILHCELESGQEARIVHIDCDRAPFDRVNQHHRILDQLRWSAYHFQGYSGWSYPHNSG